MSHPVHKSNAELGLAVHKHLLSKGLETPITDLVVSQTADEKIAKIAPLFKQIMETLGLDLKDDSLEDTPNRVAKMYVNEIFWGLDYTKFPKCTTIDNKMDYNHSFVLERNVNVQSNCEHHFVVIDGLATVAYIPNKKVLGLSKLNRIVEFFAKRPQVQERLTEQICEAIAFITETEHVAVYIDAAHYCVKSRGIQDTGSSTVTLSTRGLFSAADSEVRREFLNIARIGSNK
jgi:GTP cyclohydrolase IA